MRKLGLAVICLAAISAGVALSGGAEAMPIGLPGSVKVSNVDQVRWVCNPWGRCWWRPNYYVAPAYGYYGYGPRFGYYGGWHHHWHHWRRW
jgi:hypothetical protein